MKRKKQRKTTKLPPSFRPLFWSYRFCDLKQDKDAPLIVKQIVLHGDLRQLQWMIGRYSKQKIAHILSHTSESELRPSSVEFVKTAFNITSMPHVRCVPHTKC